MVTLPRSQRPLAVGEVLAIHGVVLVAAIAAVAIGVVAHAAIAYAAAGAIVAGELIVFVALQRRAGGIARRLADAVALVEQAREPEAAAMLDELAAASRWIPNLHAVIVHRRAGLCFAAGDLDRADALDRAVVRSGWLARPRSALHVAYPSLCAELAIIAALRGDDADAIAWHDRAHASVTDVRRGTLVFMDAVLLARRGEFAEAQRQILAVGAAGRVPTPAARVLRWILAFAAARVDAPAERAADVARTVEAARGATREVLALEPWWPELAAFVRARVAAAA